MKKLLILLALIFFFFHAAYSQPDPYNIITNQSGVKCLYQPGLYADAGELAVLIDSLSGNSVFFETVGCDFYPTLVHADPDDSFDYLFSVAKSLMTQESYLMVSKEHWSDGSLHYRTHIKFPNIPVFNNMNAVEKEAIISKVNNTINSEILNHDNQNINSFIAESMGIRAFTNIVRFGITNDILSESGWSEKQIESANYDRSAAVPFLNGGSEVIDFTGLKVALSQGGTNYQSIKGVFENTLSVVPLSLSIVITDDIVNTSDMATAKDYVEQTLQTDVIMWIHFGLDEFDHPNKMYYKATNTMTEEEAANFMNDEFNDSIINTLKDTEAEADNRTTNSCDPSWTWAKDCFFEGLNPNDFKSAVGLGFVDGILSFFHLIYQVGSFVYNVNKSFYSWFGDAIYSAAVFVKDVVMGQISIRQAYDSIIKEIDSSLSAINNFRLSILGHYAIFELYWNQLLSVAFEIYEKYNSDQMLTMITIFAEKLATNLKSWFVSEIVDGIKDTGYLVGIIMFEVVSNILLSAVTLGGYALASAFPKFIRLGKMFMKSADDFIAYIAKNLQDAKKATGALKCKILYGGCFVKDTPVLMASNANQFSFKNTGRALAVAAAMPIVAVPIQEVQLLGYAVAHETVNSTYGLTASVDDDIYLGLLDKDPYTSDQQRERDEYEINDTDWNEVVFEEVNGSSTAKLALHNDWIKDKGYQVEGIVNLDLPEQGISGPFKITSIKHIIPQKKPTDEDESDDYGYKPVTALFTHESNQVYTIDFDNGESLGITYQHPIYSVTKGGWKLAGELEVGEEVLTKEGEAIVTSSGKKEGSETVYNLEIKELHNFLVGKSGVLVHNNCIKQISKASDEVTLRQTIKTATGAGDEIVEELVEELAEEGAELAIKSGRKLTWPELKALWKRGNDFNDKGVAQHSYSKCEIHLGNGKRLDTYIPGDKIISRKATDLDNIQESTWRKYCNELVTKYKKGIPVNSSKMPGEPPLSGKYYLEIPASNQSASKLADYLAIAKSYGIEDIIFLVE